MSETEPLLAKAIMGALRPVSAACDLRINADSAMVMQAGTLLQQRPALTTRRKDRPMAAKPLPSPELLRQLLRYEPDTGLLFWRPRGRPVWDSRYPDTPALDCKNSGGYKGGFVLGRSLKSHRVIWAMHYGYWPSEIDHIDGNRCNNVISNLREVTKSENAKNRALRSDNKIGYVGVSDDRNGKFRARIHVAGKEVSLGSFATPELAANARKKASRKFGYTERHGDANG